MKNKSYIGNLTVSSNQPYIVYGSVRGLVSEHRTQDAAAKSLARDQRACRKLSSGLTRSYSDASVYEWTDEGWTVCEVAA
jgi:hypothetical protein